MQDSTKHYDFFFHPDIVSKEGKDAIKAVAEQEVTICLQSLGEKRYFGRKIQYFVVPDYLSSYQLLKLKPSISTFTVTPDTLGYYSFFYLNMIGKPVFRIQERFILVQLLANEMYNGCDILTDNYLGIYAVNSYKGYDLHQLSAYLHKKMKTDIFAFVPPLDGHVSVPQYASFIKFIAETYGTRNIINLCKDDFTIPSRNQLIAEWKEMLKTTYSNNPAQDTIKYLQYLETK